MEAASSTQYIAKSLFGSQIFFGTGAVLTVIAAAIWVYLCDYRPRTGESARVAAFKARLLAMQLSLAYMAVGLVAIAVGYTVSRYVFVRWLSPPHMWAIAHMGFHTFGVLSMLAALFKLVRSEQAVTIGIVGAVLLLGNGSVLIFGSDPTLKYLPSYREFVPMLFVNTELLWLLSTAGTLGVHVWRAERDAETLAGSIKREKED